MTPSKQDIASMQDPRDFTITKLQSKIELMDEEKEVFRRSISSLEDIISSLEDKVKQLEDLNKSYESKVHAFESIFEAMNGEAQEDENDDTLPEATPLSDSSDFSEESSESSSEEMFSSDDIYFGRLEI